MRFWDSLAGRIKCRLVSASLEQAVNRISACCDISNLEIVDDLTATFWICRNDLHLVQNMYEHVTVIRQTGIYWSLMHLKCRPVLVIGISLLLFMIFYLPSRVLFLSVNGNVFIPDTAILDAAENCGVTFGASRRYVRSEIVKNTLLQLIPQLQWACINTKGCVAEITVQERSLDMDSNTQIGTNIVASRDGIITGVTVYKGIPLCRIGQIVRKGQLLVSGYSDLGLIVKPVGADAEITAETMHSLVAVALPSYITRNDCVKVTNRYSLQIGKKLINFSKDSGISPPECGRINKIYKLTLPGGYQLPLAVIHQQTLYYDTTRCTVENVDSFDWLRDSADRIIQNQMVAGQIIKRTATIQNNGKICCLTAHYRCSEMIAIVQKKEMDVVHGKRN